MEKWRLNCINKYLRKLGYLINLQQEINGTDTYLVSSLSVNWGRSLKADVEKSEALLSFLKDEYNLDISLKLLIKDYYIPVNYDSNKAAMVRVEHDSFGPQPIPVLFKTQVVETKEVKELYKVLEDTTIKALSTEFKDFSDTHSFKVFKSGWNVVLFLSCVDKRLKKSKENESNINKTYSWLPKLNKSDLNLPKWMHGSGKMKQMSHKIVSLKDSYDNKIVYSNCSKLIDILEKLGHDVTTYKMELGVVYTL